jgi:UDP-N-acetylmuramyl pentapeptide phosphotransferase/UDP-N-acetylglucosamine-1-phosphate transferase
VSAIEISWIVFACVFGGAIFGLFLRAALPEHHLSADSKDIVKLGMGLIGTMAALLLGLLIASAKSSYDTQNGELTQMAAKIALLDRVLAHYGPETKESRTLLHLWVEQVLEQNWSRGNSEAGLGTRASAGEILYDKVQDLSPQSEAQRSLQIQALNIVIAVGELRYLLFEQKANAISAPFLVVVVFWLTIIFVSFGLFAPRNATVVVTLLVCALSVSGAIFLVVELNRPFEGLIQIPSTPLQQTLAKLGQ